MPATGVHHTDLAAGPKNTSVQTDEYRKSGHFTLVYGNWMYGTECFALGVRYEVQVAVGVAGFFVRRLNTRYSEDVSRHVTTCQEILQDFRRHVKTSNRTS